MCALASTGQLDAAEQTRFEEHLAACRSCREMLADLDYLRFNSIPVMAARRVEDSPPEPPVGIRDRFLARLDGGPIPPPVLIRPSVARAQGEPGRDIGREERAWRPKPQPLLRGFLPAKAIFAAFACLVFGLFGFSIARHRYSMPAAPQATSAVAVADPALSAPGQPLAGRALPENSDAAFQAKIDSLSVQLAAMELEKQQLAEQLAAQLSEAGRRDVQSAQQLQAKVNQLQDSADQIRKLKADLDAAAHKLAQSDTIQILQQHTAEELMAKLRAAELQLEREREAQTGRSEAAQLISARNLHIVDVHESEPGGKQQRAFGRVFYVEGQSLIFYAYDLAAVSRGGHRIVFHVWGETAGVKEANYILGILHSDDPSQSRWVLTFDDPKILNRINAVYITADQDERAKHQPQGPKVLYAFLGSPNHP
jgi:hypothetical protein